MTLPPLTEKEVQEIQREAIVAADAKFPKRSSIESMNKFIQYKQGYIAAATIYRQREKVLVEALEKIRDWKDSWDADSPHYIAKQYLSTYNR